jgi:hypothetical protein
MADINKIIKELWQKTYRGQDIDYIQVRYRQYNTHTQTLSLWQACNLGLTRQRVRAARSHTHHTHAPRSTRTDKG